MSALLDLLLPPRCPGCGLEGAVLCDACTEPLARRLDEPAGAPIGLPVRMPANIVQLEWCAAFTGPPRAAIHALKYDGERRLVRPLAEMLAARWRRAGAGGSVLVPVPVHVARLRDRGFDQAVLLARALGPMLGLPVVEAVARQESTRAQHALGQQDRSRNVQHAFACRQDAVASVRGRWVILIDDVVTTGATIASCAEALRRAGVTAVSALTVARER